MPSARGSGEEAETFELADDFAADGDGAGIVEHEIEPVVVAQPAHEDCGAPVDETLSQPLVQRIGEPVFDRARLLLPMGGVLDPARTMRGVGPGADLGEAAGQRGHVAFGLVQTRDTWRASQSSGSTPSSLIRWR